MTCRRMIFVEDLPLIGCIAFGLIDRGTNIIQVRPSSMCPLSCIFCSTDAGPNSRHRLTEYIVDLDLLIEWFDYVVEFKGRRKIEAHIDTVGDPLTYPQLVELVQRLSEIKGVEVISLQTHGVLLSEKIVDELAEAGLSRVNLSIDALDPILARKLAGTNSYNVHRIMEIAEYIASKPNLDLLIAPVWVPGINDEEIPKIIEYALKIGAGKKWPALGIQKYEVHKRGRKPKGVKSMSWSKFYKKLAELEKKYKTKLILKPEDFGIHKRPMVPILYRKGEKVLVEIVEKGWLKGELLAVDKRKQRVITVVEAQVPIGTKMYVKVIANKHNLYIAKPL